MMNNEKRIIQTKIRLLAKADFVWLPLLGEQREKAPVGLFLEAKSSTQGVREASYACDNERLCGRTGREAGTGDSLRSKRSVEETAWEYVAEQKRMQDKAHRSRWPNAYLDVRGDHLRGATQYCAVYAREEARMAQDHFLATLGRRVAVGDTAPFTGRGSQTISNLNCSLFISEAASFFIIHSKSA